jgi:hypothetical protein
MLKIQLLGYGMVGFGIRAFRNAQLNEEHLDGAGGYIHVVNGFGLVRSPPRWNRSHNHFCRDACYIRGIGLQVMVDFEASLFIGYVQFENLPNVVMQGLYN